MLSLLSGLGFYWFLYWCWRHRPWVMALMAFLIVSFALRVFGVMYLDLFGPVLAIELNYNVGGGVSTPLFVVSLLIVFAAVLFFQGRLRVDAAQLDYRWAGGRTDVLANVIFLVAAAWLASCYFEMLASGHIPLLEGMDRLVYEKLHGKFLYPLLYDYSFLYSATLGFFFVRKRIAGGIFDYRYGYLETLLWLFFALTGNRYSAFYVSGSFFAMPLAALVYLNRKKIPLPQAESAGWLHRILTYRWARLSAAAGVLVLLAGLVLNNFYNVRYTDFSEVAENTLFQRILVQPVELYAVTWENIALGGSMDANLAWDLMFDNPIDATRNTGIQFLMVRALGDQRAAEIISYDAQYAGGYPEVFIESFGLFFSFVAMALVASALGWLYLQILKAAIHGRFFTFFFACYVLFGFTLIYIGGMLNFLLPWTFWMKVALLLLALVCEPIFIRSARKPKVAMFPLARRAFVRRA